MLSFLGLQVQFGAEGKVIFHPRRWMLHLHQERNWVHLRGSQSLLQAEFVGNEDEEDPNFAKELKQAQTELGCLLWVATKTQRKL